MGQTGKNVLVRQKEHRRHLKLGHVEQYTSADHGWRTGHTILFEHTEMLYRSDQWSVRTTRESLERMLSQGAIKQEGVKLNAAWLSACELLKVKVKME